MIECDKIRVIRYGDEILNYIRDERIVLKMGTLEHLVEHFREALHDKEIVAVVADLPFVAISEIQWHEEWESIPLIVNAYNVGDYSALLRIAPLLRRLNVRIYLSNANDNVFTDLKFLSSLGIDCGLIFIDGVVMSDDLFLDFASYYYLSKGCHASVEPFEFILRHIDDDKNTSFSDIYFENSMLFAFDNANDGNVNNHSGKVKSYYAHFLDLDKCAKCPAFKICDYNMLGRLRNCSEAMGEVFDMAEMRKQLNNQKYHQKTVCQL